MILAEIPSPPIEWSVLHLGPLNVHVYALTMLLGMVAAAVITDHRLRARGAERWITIDFVLWTIPLGLIGARLWHVITHPNDYFAGQPLWKTIAIWEGGNAIIGAVIGGAVGALIASRFTGIRLTAFADALAPGMLVAQAIGRIGNYFNNELFGEPTDLPWGLRVNDAITRQFGYPAGTTFHPTFLYEFVLNLLGAAVLFWLWRRFASISHGQLFGLYLAWYGAVRIFTESIRVDPSEVILGLRSNTWGAIGFFVVGIGVYLFQRLRHRGEPRESVYAEGRGPSHDLDGADRTMGVAPDSPRETDAEALAEGKPVAAPDGERTARPASRSVADPGLGGDGDAPAV